MDSIGRVTAKIDDFFTIMTILAEKHILDKFLMFVLTDPDMMLSIKLSEGDMRAVFLKVSKLEIEIVAIKQSIADNAFKLDHRGNIRMLLPSRKVSFAKKRLDQL